MISTLQPPRSLSHFRSNPTLLLRYTSLKPLSSLSSQPVTHSTITDQSQSPNPPSHSQILSTRHSLLSRHLTATQLAESFLTRLRLTEPHLRSFLHVSDSVLAQARELDEKIQRNEELGPLAGVLVAIKDNICTAEMPSTAGSRVLEGYTPPYDATAVRKIKELGGIVVGKTNLDEFGMGSTTEASAYQVFLFWVSFLLSI